MSREEIEMHVKELLEDYTIPKWLDYPTNKIASEIFLRLLDLGGLNVSEE